MEIGIIASLIIGGVVIYLDLRNKIKKSERQLENLTVSAKSLVRRGQLMENVITEKQKEEYSNTLEHDVIVKLIMETDTTKRSEYLKRLGDSDEKQYYEITSRVSAMKGNGE